MPAGSATPRVSVSRSVLPIVSTSTGRTSAARPARGDTVGYLDGGIARFGKTYAGEPGAIAEELAEMLQCARPTRCC